ncbi:uncharacterized protein LOC120529410 [Polypterus senegalus]|uniref:uncharacterized protein LOC120529410 n=1 Tax=Polypterus senegalus TaxID=55291 RepID=UPI001965353B|nr:uncharacterized protein LOC120529410 [Polypterus senegalus]
MERALGLLLCLQGCLFAVALRCSDKLIVSAVEKYNKEHTQQQWFDCIKVKIIKPVSYSDRSYYFKFQIGETLCNKTHLMKEKCFLQKGQNEVTTICSALGSELKDNVILLSCKEKIPREFKRAKRNLQDNGQPKKKPRPGIFSGLSDQELPASDKRVRRQVDNQKKKKQKPPSHSGSFSPLSLPDKRSKRNLNDKKKKPKPSRSGSLSLLGRPAKENKKSKRHLISEEKVKQKRQIRSYGQNHNKKMRRDLDRHRRKIKHPFFIGSYSAIGRHQKKHMRFQE